MRNESCRTVLARVEATQDTPFFADIDISGLNISNSVKQLILNCYQSKQPFGLSTNDGENVVYFFPGHGCAVWCDDGNVTLNTFQNDRQFQDCLKVVLVAHRKFLGLLQIGDQVRYKEIVEQLKRIG